MNTHSNLAVWRPASTTELSRNDELVFLTLAMPNQTSGVPVSSPSSSQPASGRNQGKRKQNRGKKPGGGPNHNNRGRKPAATNNDEPEQPPRTLMVLHGSRQTGQLLVGRIDKLRKKLQRRFNMSIVAPDGMYPHPDDGDMRQWWNRDGDIYGGLEETLKQIEHAWTSNPNCCGILGFSQGARLAHLATVCHEAKEHTFRLEGLRFVMMAAGYEASLPTNLLEAGLQPQDEQPLLVTPALHVFGRTDRLIPPQQSEEVMAHYSNAVSHEHEGGHHVPMRAADVNEYLSFIENALTRPTTPAVQKESSTMNNDRKEAVEASPPKEQGHQANDSLEEGMKESKGEQSEHIVPDEECAMAQQDEIEALQAIFPDEFTMVSKHNVDSAVYEYPIRYHISLPPLEDVGVWPPHPVFLDVVYPPTYPTDCMAKIELGGESNVLDFNYAQRDACQDAMREAAEAEMGMASMLSCVYAAREFFESGRMTELAGPVSKGEGADSVRTRGKEGIPGGDSNTDANGSSDLNEPAGSEAPNVIRTVSADRIRECQLEGLEIARKVLMDNGDPKAAAAVLSDSANRSNNTGGTWKYTIGLVGKPSAGKSTFFNAATAFARQRDDKDNALGGATMAPHPFTTIDPNVGFCLVPAPEGSCPEETNEEVSRTVGSTHGRDSKGRRLIPVMLKDVAGLVPGAYQGRGRGNKFLNDLTDADVLVHVVDASGTADTEGNAVVVAVVAAGVDEDESGGKAADDASNEGGSKEGNTEEGVPTVGFTTTAAAASAAVGGSHPLNDLAWIRGELMEWVYNNLLYKWDSVKRRGREKLAGMLTGYNQTQAVLWKILHAVERHMGQSDEWDHALDHPEDWDQGDVHRLVSAFLGARFPMALALNKKDLPSAKRCIQEVQDALPVHGAHVGIPLSARDEMAFVRRHILSEKGNAGTIPTGVWQCLQSAVTLREPVLIFPVSDMATYAPLPGLLRYASEDASLPSAAMVACLESSGGSAPSLWDGTSYNPKGAGHGAQQVPTMALRDVLVMKPGSVTEDVFLALKKMGALGGEFVRAEGAGEIGEKPKLVPKHEVLHKGIRILKIMTSKRREWQKKS